MSPSAAPQPAAAPAALYTPAQAAPLLVRTGAWAFRQRSWLPVPLGLAVIGLKTGEMDGPWPVAVGIASVVVGELLRVWAVRHIGTISRTRTSTRQGPLITSGPFRMVRNPLYLGSFILGLGFTIGAGRWVLGILFAALFLGIYLPVMRVESRTLAEMFGADYRQYALHVPLFFPRLTPYRFNAAPRVGFDRNLYLRYREYRAALGLLVAWLTLAIKAYWLT